MSSSRIFAATLLLAFGALTASAHAQGTARQRAACMGDAFKFCSSHIPNASAIEGCLRSNVSQLKPACQAVLQPREAEPQSRVAERADDRVSQRLARRSAVRTRVAEDVDTPAPRRSMARSERRFAAAPESRASAAAPDARSCLRDARRLQARVERYFNADPAGAAQDMIGMAMTFMPMITSMANGGGGLEGLNLGGMNLGGVNLGAMNLDDGDQVLQTAMSLLSQARSDGFAGYAEGCRTAVAQVEDMIPRRGRR